MARRAGPDGPRNIKIVLEYDGSRYHGWQKQKSEPETIQEKVENALCALLGEEIEVQGASRTDAGVHARGQAANFITCRPIPVPNLVRAANDKLPEDIAVCGARQVPPDFNARFSAKGKRYRYTIDTGSVRRPIDGRFALHWKHAVDIEAVRAAMEVLKGEHDFKAFASEVEEGQNTVRTLTDLNVERDGPLIHMSVAGTAFLYNMVRAIAGTLLDVGRGRTTARDVEKILSSCSRALAGPTLPARGLTLMEVMYDESELEPDDACAG